MNPAKKSVEVIKKLQTRQGGLLATFENDAYPYVYPRDGVIMTKALNLHSEYKRSKKFYYFLRDVVKNGEVLQRYHKNGLPFVSEKGEHDCPGLVLHGMCDTFLRSGDEEFIRELFPFAASCAAFIKRRIGGNGLLRTERSIHEFYRLENGYEIWANCAAARGLLDASEIAKALGKERKAKEWERAGENLRRNIKSKLYDAELGIFIKTITNAGVRLTSPDISMLSPFYFEIINSKQVLSRTLKFLRKTIWDKNLGGFKRFRKFEICKDWHWYTGGDGPWFLTMWAARFYRQLGDEKGFEECADWVDRVTSPEGFIPEHIALEKDYFEWKENEIEFSERIIRGMRRAESFKSSVEGTICWAVPLGWAQAEHVLLEETSQR